MTEELERLKEENARLKREIEEYRNRESELSLSEKKAKEKADEIVFAAEKLFNLEADRLRLFKIAWDRNFAKSKGSSERLDKLNDLAVKIDDIICGRGEYSALSYFEKTETLRKLVGEDEKLIEKGEVYIGDGKEGFSMDEILNPPKDQDLSKLLKEMGIK
ncbi:MAG: hypothetical protein J5836_02210 [Clostridia bacterium]|nr:hypothetical protein [Clostridia bacterium]